MPPYRVRAPGAAHLKRHSQAEGSDLFMSCSAVLHFTGVEKQVNEAGRWGAVCECGGGMDGGGGLDYPQVSHGGRWKGQVPVAHESMSRAGYYLRTVHLVAPHKHTRTSGGGCQSS